MGTAFDGTDENDVRIVLLRPKFEQNVAQVVRAAACFGVESIELYQPRYQPASGRKGDRRPRPLRMKDYRTVRIATAAAVPFPTGYTPVAVEFLDNAEVLWTFEHPDRAVYIFGPEDGSIERETLAQCHRVVRIPSRFCLNLASTVHIVLYDRMCKLNV
ncbi:MAG: TrmH family RNA methyltransferase [Armatimonadota bacterium]|nr:TrmH family RNA methyltransferase [Armatimonadota bacterium]